MQILIEDVEELLLGLLGLHTFLDWSCLSGRVVLFQEAQNM